MRKNNQNNKKAISLSDLKNKAEAEGKIIDWSTLTEYNGQLYVAIVPKPEKIIDLNIWIILNEQHKVVWAWERFGGSFTKGLAQALMHADPENTKKIHDTWPEYW